MSRREDLLASVIGKDMDPASAKYADATIKLLLGDMGEQSIKFWETEGPGVMCFQPNSSERSMFWLTLKELHSAEENSDGELKETFKSILEAAQKIDPAAGAGYIINDHQGMRYFNIDYNQASE
jgi:hypothetical protein